MRAVPGWQPYWAAWTDPVPLLPPVAALLLVLPLGLWLWKRGMARWHTPFMGLNLLLVGGVLGLVSYHTQVSWARTWNHWAAGLPFAGVPILTISLSPLTLWGWSRITHYRPRLFVLPNLVLTGGLLWLTVDRSRPVWFSAWEQVWGDVPLQPNPAWAAALLPVALWGWIQGRARWPRYWVTARAVVAGSVLWWVLERTRELWADTWHSFAGGAAPNPALLVGLAPIGVWGWSWLRRQWPVPAVTAGWVIATLTIGWTVGRLLPMSDLVFRSGVAVLPVLVWGWGRFLRARPRLGWTLTLLPWLAVALLALVWPQHFQTLQDTVLSWLSTQATRTAK